MPFERDPADKDDHDEYFYIATRQRLDLAMHTLEGLVSGAIADGKLNDAELGALALWLGQHEGFAKRHPFNEVIPTIQKVIVDRGIDESDRADLLWLCNQYATEENYYDAVTCDMQRLQGFLAGVLADGTITEDELGALSAWMDDHEHLRACWPYDEIESLITAVMRDGKIDEREQGQLKHFFGEFANVPGHKAAKPLDPELSVSGICALCPEILFEERYFCFTGASKRSNRKGLAAMVGERGGAFHDNLRNDTHYLIIGADGNPCWAFACYGRKVEDAMARRRQGQKLLIVHENDFWDAVGDT